MTATRDRTPGSAARRPRPWTLRGLWMLVRRTGAEAWEDRIFGLAAEAGFWSLLSLPPLLLVVLGITGYASEAFPAHSIAELQKAILDACRTVLTEDSVQRLVKPAVQQVFSSGGRAGVLSVGLVVSLWSGSTAMATYVNTITIAYDLRGVRSAVRSRLLALALFLMAVAVGVVLLPLLVLGPGLVSDLPPPQWHDLVASLVHALYWPVVALGSTAMLATMYHLSVPVRTSWHRDLPGAAVAMALLVVGSYGLRLYITFAFSTAGTYGPLSAPIAVLLFFYITALAVLFGAELNAEIDKLWPGRETARARHRRDGTPGDADVAG